MPGISVAVITNADGTHIDEFLPSLAEIAEVETVALVDPSGAMEARARKALGAKLRAVHKDVPAMYKAFRPTLALVTLEPRLSPPAIDAALEANCHVLSEKPGCLRVEDFAPLVAQGPGPAPPSGPRPGQSHARPGPGSPPAHSQGSAGRIYGVEIHIVADQTRLKWPGYRETWQCIRNRGGGATWPGSASCGSTWPCTSPACAWKPWPASPASSAGSRSTSRTPPSCRSSSTMRCLGTMTSAYYLDRGVQSHIQIWGETAGSSWQPWKSNRCCGTQHPRRQGATRPGVHLSARPRGYTPFLRLAVQAAAGMGEPPMNADECLALLQAVYGFYRAAQSERVHVIGK